MTFEYSPDEYVRRLMEYSELDETVFSPDEDKATVIGKLKSISEKKRNISDIENSIIYEYIERFENGSESLDEEAAEKLYAFLNTLIPVVPQVYDAPIGIRLSWLLYNYYRETGDIEKEAFVISRGAICEAVQSAQLDEHDFLTFPRLCEELFPYIDLLSEEMQLALLSTYGFRIIVKAVEGVKKVFSEFPVVEDRIRFYGRKIEPNKLGSILFKLNLNFINIVAMMLRDDDENRKLSRPLNFNVDVERYRKLLEASLKKVEDGFDLYPLDPYNDCMFRMSYVCARYHLGHISFEELLEGIDALEETEGGKGPFYFQLNAFYLMYIHSSSPYSKEKDAQLIHDRVKKVMPRILEMKRQKQFQFGPTIMVFVGATSFTENFYEFYDTVLDFTIYADKALFVHTQMVSEISQVLLERMLEEDPSFFDGVNGWNTDYIRNHKDEVSKLLGECAMCHDIGKHYLIDIVSNSSRTLTDDEFAIIRTHPGNIENVYQNNIDHKSRVQCIHDCAILHHRWHNGEGGYPDLPQTNNRPFVDIISIADSIDAATDYIGRPYGSGKTLDELIDEFRTFAGTRYSSEVTKVLYEPDIKAKVEDLITNRREEISYRVYSSDSI